jgi:phospholipid-binding lipoprotein MlaA
MDVVDARRHTPAESGHPSAHPYVSMRPAPLRTVLLLLAAALLTAAPVGAESLATGTSVPALGSPAPEAEALDAPATDPTFAADEEVQADYDPWQPFNERTFAFNHGVLDRFLIKPVAKGWDILMPDAAQRGLGRAFDNLDMPRRVVNNLLQLRPKEAVAELVRFVVNTTVGIVGLFDVANLALHLEKSDADMGQTLGFYGIGTGPYLVLPFLPPLTVRDGIGRGVDSVLDPFGFFIPFVASTTMGIVKQVNDRSLNLELFANVEESVLDLYSAVRNGYLQRRRSTIEERRAARFHLHHDVAVARAVDPNNAAIVADALAIDGDRT